MKTYRILYRGSLSSCNFDCSYCPFAKTTNTKEELRVDAEQLQKFVEWVSQTDNQIGVMFTPWGEAIIHSYYRQAMIRLSQLPNVERVSMQTNLSCRLDDFEAVDRDAFSLWTTFHPDQVSLDRFLERCNDLIGMDIRFSVGVVGLRQHFDAIQQLRDRLPGHVYVWINSYKREPDYYQEQDLEFLNSIDPYFHLNCHYYPSAGEGCRAGDTAFTIDGNGDVRRCHFIDKVIANIYRDDIFASLRPTLCTNQTCGCHIGYVNQHKRKLDQLFEKNILERIPASWPIRDPRFTAANLK